MSTADIIPTPKTIKVTGGELVLEPLTLRDIRDGEKELGPFGQWFPSQDPTQFKVTNLIYVLWLLCRKHGISKDDRIKGKWKYTLDELSDMVTYQDLLKHHQVIMDFLTSESQTGSNSLHQPSQQDSGGAKS